MSNPITVLIADDHPIFRKGLRDVLAAERSLRLVAEVGDGATALEQIAVLKPQVAVLDVAIPRLDGLQVAEKVRQQRLRTAVVLLTMLKDEETFNAAMDAGVLGYVLKENAVEDLLKCIHAVVAGQPFLSPSLSGFLMHRHSQARALVQETPGLDLLTPTERRILG